MTWIAPDVGRSEDYPERRNEPEQVMLRDWLDWHRATLLRKCAGLDGTQLATRAVPPSNLSLLGLVRHMSDTERGWVRQTYRGEQVPDLYYRFDAPDADFEEAHPTDAEEDLERYRAECRAVDAALEGAKLDETFIFREKTTSVRWMWQHLVEEYARHNGQADLIREVIDGSAAREEAIAVADTADLTRLLVAIAKLDHKAAVDLLKATPSLATARLARRDEFFLAERAAQVYEGDTALHAAAFSYDRQMARDLITRGAGIRARNRRGAEPIHAAGDRRSRLGKLEPGMPAGCHSLSHRGGC